jgi:hypothetical protein
MKKGNFGVMSLKENEKIASVICLAELVFNDSWCSS